MSKWSIETHTRLIREVISHYLHRAHQEKEADSQWIRLEIFRFPKIERVELFVGPSCPRRDASSVFNYKAQIRPNPWGSVAGNAVRDDKKSRGHLSFL